MLLKIIFAVADALIILALVYENINWAQKSPSSVFAEIGSPLCEPFDIEKECLKLQEEREKQEPYLITLWWGFDGLRLNVDGSTEWISRRESDENSVDSGLAQILQNSLENEIATMQLHQMRYQLQSVYAYQNMNMQSTIQHQIAAQCQNAVLPAYPTYAPLLMTQNTP